MQMLRLPRVKRMILADKSLAASLAWSLTTILAAAELRMLIDGGKAGAPFVTFFPVIVLTSLLFRWQWATLSATLAAIIGNRIVRPGAVWDFDASDFLMATLFASSCIVLIYMGHAMRGMLRAEDASREREKILNAELQHRIRNMLAIVRSLASQTFTKCEPSEFLEVFSGRIRALADSTAVREASDDETELRALVDAAVAPFEENKNFELNGPNATLAKDSVVPIGLALHELCTNALKYGALSAVGGKVRIQWDKRGKDLHIRWREFGGPTVEKPTRAGLGTALLRGQRGLRDVECRFLPNGLECDMRI